jgi:hypothetical protein
MREPRIAVSARRHGVLDADMRHAFRHALWVHKLEEGFAMLVGPGRDGTFLEVGVVNPGSGDVIVHAMRARPKFFR